MRRVLVVASSSLLVAAAGAAIATVDAPSVGVASRATVVAVGGQSSPARYPVYDGRGHVAGSAQWLVTPIGGNCCETYVAATADGRLLEYGGSLPYYSDDKGRTWHRVTFPTPVVNGEGAIVAGPHGTVYGVGWDAYTGDHLQAVRFEAGTASWDVGEAPGHSPFYDREWLTYAEGPFIVGGSRVGALTYVVGGGLTKDEGLLSGDGLTYDVATVPYADEQSLPTVPATIPVVPNRDADWWQPHPDAGTLPLSGGGLLYFRNNDDLSGEQGCAAARLRPEDARWQCVTLPFRVTGTVRQDSRGWLTMVTPSRNHVTLALSRDGGRSWRSTTLLPPRGGTVEGDGALYDVKVVGVLGQAVVSARVDDPRGNGQDMVFRVDVSSPQPRLLRTYLVGRGDLDTTIGVVGATSDRYDFESVALLPDGAIAVSFDDRTTPYGSPLPRKPGQCCSPALAILR